MTVSDIHIFFLQKCPPLNRVMAVGSLAGSQIIYFLSVDINSFPIMTRLRHYTYATFTLAVIILAGEVLKDRHQIDLTVITTVQSISTMTLIFALPLMYLFTANEKEVDQRRWGIRRMVFSCLSWLFYFLCLVSAMAIVLGGWKLVCSNNFGALTLVAMLAVLSFVFFISSSQEEAHGCRKDKLEIFFTMKLLLVLVASFLAVLAEMSLHNRGNKRLAALEGENLLLLLKTLMLNDPNPISFKLRCLIPIQPACVSAALFTIVLFNTHGLGGRLMHTKDNHRVRSGSTASATSSDRSMSPQSTPDSSPQRGQPLSDGDGDDDISPPSEDEADDKDDIVHPSSSWTFFQPFVGGIKFVLLQILSWYVSYL